MTSTKQNEPIRQGDLTFYPVSNIPMSEVFDTRSDVVAIGEGKDHFHKVQSNGLVQVFEPEKDSLETDIDGHKEQAFKFVHAEQDFDLVHIDKKGNKANHDPLQIPKGDYVVLREREYDPLEREAVDVLD